MQSSMVRRKMVNMRSPWMIRIIKSMKQHKPPLPSNTSEIKQMISALYTPLRMMIMGLC